MLPSYIDDLDKNEWELYAKIERKKKVPITKKNYFAFSLLNTVSVEKCWGC